MEKIIATLIIGILLGACGDAAQEADQQATDSPVEDPAPEPTAPRAPRSVIATPADGQITLSWASVSTATSYSIFWNTTGSVSTEDQPIVDIKSPYLHTGLTNDTTYYYAVHAINSIGKSELSTEVSVIPSPFVVWYVDSTAPNDEGTGLTVGTAKRTIKAAIDAATAPARIQVRGGFYEVDSNSFDREPTHLQLVDGVSLYGGYNADFTSRDPSLYVTTVTDIGPDPLSSSSSSTRTVISAGPGISSATIVDGFTLNGNTQAGPWLYTIVITAYSRTVAAGSSATFQNNIINGGGGRESIGVYAINPRSMMFQNNIINGGSGSNFSTGLFIYGGSATIQNNIIDGGTGKATIALRAWDGPPVTVRNNTINAGSGGPLTTRAFGIAMNRSRGIIENNIIIGATTYEGNGCINTVYGTKLLLFPLRNNVFFNCQTVYSDKSGGQGAPSKCPYAGGGCTLAEMEVVTGGSGNVEVNPYLVDWRLSPASPTAVTQGGLNGIDEAWGFATDKDGATRPGAGTPWAIGAYEPEP